MNKRLKENRKNWWRILVDWRELLSLEDGEFVVKDWIVVQGICALTNKKLIFLESQRGVIRTKSYKVIEEFPLESIKDIAEEKRRIGKGRTIIYTTKGKHFFGSILCTSGKPRSKDEFEHFRQTVLLQIKERRQELERKKISVVVDFSFLKTFIEKGGIALTTLKCPHCSAPIKMPKRGAETVCEHCGSTVYAQDIFEKVKKLME